MFTITWLTLRQFARARSLIVVAGICFFPVLFGVIPLFILDAELSSRALMREIGNNVFLGFFVATLLPLATLVLATAAFGDEIEDSTLQYLILKPVSRLRIVAEKLLAIIIVMIPVASAGMFVTWAVFSWGRFGDTVELLWPMAAAIIVGVLGFTSIFLTLSLFIPRALLAGIFYVFIWEATLSQFLPGIRQISIQHYAQSLFVRLTDTGLFTVDQLAAQPTIILAVAGVLSFSVAISVLRLRTMSYE